MTDEKRARQETRTRSKLLEGLTRAERKLFTRNAPKLSKARMKFLRTREKSSTRRLAEHLGVSRRTMERRLSGASTKPNKRLDAALERETESEWKPQVRARAKQRAASSSGVMIPSTLLSGSSRTARRTTSGYTLCRSRTVLPTPPRSWPPTTQTRRTRSCTMRPRRPSRSAISSSPVAEPPTSRCDSRTLNGSISIFSSA
ncbi:telomere-protecting terminal protein Tpg [Streptomyces sp. NPDC057235]|uniref:telomere-protecting terminal protein Tpg n=1 Tax=Streptomyces sp. NPDC057235 TaxID=3346058 RepID=UPI00362A5E03